MKRRIIIATLAASCTLTMLPQATSDTAQKITKQMKNAQQEAVRTISAPVLQTAFNTQHKLEIALDPKKALLDAVKRGDFAKVTKIIDAGVDINATDDFLKEAALAKALSAINPNEINPEIIKIIHLLISKGADVNAKDDRGNTPLTWATYFLSDTRSSHIEIIKQLLDKGADVNAKTQGGSTPLTNVLTRWSPDIDVVKLLLDRGADVNLIGGLRSEETPLIHAATGNCAYNEDILKLLLSKKPSNINYQNEYDGNTALILATEANNNPEIVRLLIQAGADVKIKNKDGKTALDYAQSDEIKNMLKKAGA